MDVEAAFGHEELARIDVREEQQRVGARLTAMPTKLIQRFTPRIRAPVPEAEA